MKKDPKPGQGFTRPGRSNNKKSFLNINIKKNDFGEREILSEQRNLVDLKIPKIKGAK